MSDQDLEDDHEDVPVLAKRHPTRAASRAITRRHTGIIAAWKEHVMRVFVFFLHGIHCIAVRNRGVARTNERAVRRRRGGKVRVQCYKTAITDLVVSLFRSNADVSPEQPVRKFCLT